MNRLIQVCAECGTALCAQGEMMCAESRHAGLDLVPEKDLSVKSCEHADHYSDAKIRKVYGESAPFGHGD